MDLKFFYDELRYSHINSIEPDPQMFPLFYKAKRYEYVLNPGERLYIPPGWFHLIQSSEVDKGSKLNIAVNYWFNTKTPKNTPQIKWHTINEDIALNELKKLGTIRYQVSDDGIFYSTNLAHRFPQNPIKFFYTSYDDFFNNNNPKCYSAQNRIPSSNINIEENLEIVEQVNIWLNRGNARVVLHNDGFENWLCQVSGKKRVILFPPSERHNLYILNPYPENVVEYIRRSFETSPTFFNFDNQFTEDIRERLHDLYEVYHRLYLTYKAYILKLNCHIFNDSTVPNVRFEVFEVQCHHTPIRNVIGNIDCRLLFSVTGGVVSLGRYSHLLNPGSVFASLETIEYPLTLERGVYILPIKENNT